MKQDEELAALRAENARLRDALKFYGHRPHYAARNGMDSAISRDNFGDQARAALGAENEG